jgi:hypothetical protein
MLNPLADIKRPRQQKALRIIPLNIMALIIIRQKLIVAQTEHFRIGFDFLLLFGKFERFFLELLERGLMKNDFINRFVMCALQDCAHLLVFFLKQRNYA